MVALYQGEIMAKKAENAANLIMSKINENNLIHDPTHVTVNVRTTGFLFWKKTAIYISGRVETGGEKEEVDKILETGGGGFTTINDLRVHKR